MDSYQTLEYRDQTIIKSEGTTFIIQSKVYKLNNQSRLSTTLLTEIVSSL